MLKEFKHRWSTEIDNWKNKSIFLAISGGKDSMALSNILLKLGISHHLLHCNFQLRGKESDLDEKFVKEYALENNLEFSSKRFDTKLFASQNKLTIQEAARKLRYEWFDTIVKNDSDSILFTAHHGTDSIETFFLNLMRGSGLKGLTGIPLKRGYVMRPLLPFSVDVIIAYIDKHQIDYREDQSNLDTLYQRNFIRHEILPLINERSTDFDKKMESTFASLQSIQSYLAKQAQRQHQSVFRKKNKYIEANINDVLTTHKAILTIILEDYGIRRSQFDAFKSFLNSISGSQFHTTSHRFTIHGNVVYIEPNNKIVQSNQSLKIDRFGKTYKFSDSDQLFILLTDDRPANFSSDLLQWDANKVTLPLNIRIWREGDRFNPLGMAGSKLVSDFITDKKINPIEKQQLQVVIDGEKRIIGIIGHTIADHSKIDASTKTILILKQAL
ncbi:MAG: tRNA lysidine(34) synthetase TilS [Crocinitomicaceae bacterium]